MSSTNADVVVVGAGIIGAACARAFAEQGLRVVVLDAGPIGGGATATTMGHLVVMDDSPAQFALTSYSRRLWDQILGELPCDCEYQPAGTLWIAADEEEMELVRRKARYHTDHDVAVEVLDTAELAKVEPNLRADLLGGLRVPGDSVIYPPCAARWLLDRARDRGATVQLGITVVKITDAGVQLADGSSISAGLTINAAGTDAIGFVPETNTGLDVRPRKGHLLITDRVPGFLNHQAIELGYLKSAHAISADTVAFNVQPRKTGQLLVGSSRQYDDQTTTVRMDLVRRMLARAFHFLPSLGGISALRTWTGFRAATSDKLPLIGLVPGYQRVYLATGHEGLGITMSLATAALLVDEFLGRESPIPRTPYSPSRFDEGRNT